MAISILTLVVLSAMLTMEFALARSPIGLPLIESGILGVLSIFWLAFNAFSTARWKYLPMQCEAISVAFPERAWCRDVHALKAFVWIVFGTCLGITIWTLTYTLTQYKKGHKHVLKTPLSQYEPSDPLSNLGLDGKEGVDWYPASSFANSAPVASESGAGAKNAYAFTAAVPTISNYDYDSGTYYNSAAQGTSSGMNAYPFASGIGSQSLGGGNGANVTRSLSGSKYVQYEKENPFERLPPAPTPKPARKALERDAAAAW
ncbi:hypothetical protein BKA70DRAFT_1432528 [Coprinopsis sp. MPI-PUGE-AT-0042]|nr:hypothetical protein BKA70DRAFT_1432528 [Coprinopsis sp. MPI-PUGE-AT-0042]